MEFPYSTRNASRIRLRVGNGSVLMGTECLNTRFIGYLYLPYYVRKQKKLEINIKGAMEQYLPVYVMVVGLIPTYGNIIFFIPSSDFTSVVLTSATKHVISEFWAENGERKPENMRLIYAFPYLVGIYLNSNP